jgi:hypothetical protein
MSALKRIAHAGTAILVAGHIAAHLAGEAMHEGLIEIAISPIMHFVEHHVGRAEAEAGIIEEAKPAPVAIDPRIFRAHHRVEK